MNPPLRPIHPDDRLLESKLIKYRLISTEELLKSLLPGETGALKTRLDGTILDGHHRLKVLRERSVDVHGLPREVIPKQLIDPLVLGGEDAGS